MKILPKTPRTEMAHTAIINKMGEVFESLGTELGYGSQAVDMQMSRLATISARVVFGKDEVDFSVIEFTDSPETIKTKFLKYIDTTCYRVMDEALRQIAAMDLPMTPREQQPEAPKADEKNS